MAKIADNGTTDRSLSIFLSIYYSPHFLIFYRHYEKEVRYVTEKDVFIVILMLILAFIAPGIAFLWFTIWAIGKVVKLPSRKKKDETQ